MIRIDGDRSTRRWQGGGRAGGLRAFDVARPGNVLVGLTGPNLEARRFVSDVKELGGEPLGAGERLRRVRGPLGYSTAREEDVDEAACPYRQAAEAGSAPAAFVMADRYESG